MHNVYCAAGLFGVALLALTACGPADDGASEEPAPPETAEEGAPEEDSAPDEEEVPEGPGDEAPQVPELEEIEDEIWDASAAQDSVSISGEMPASLFGWDSLAAEEDTDQQTGAAQNVDVTVAGEAEGQGSVYQVGDVFDYVIFGDDIYQSVDSVVAEYELSQPPEGTEAPSSEEVRQAFEAEGTWTNVGPAGRDFVETPADFITNFYEGLLTAAELESLAAVGLEGHTDAREGQDVWVYRKEQGEDFVELVVTADESQPLLKRLSYDMTGSELEVSFSDWNEAEPPQEPDAEEVIEPDQVQVILDSLG